MDYKQHLLAIITCSIAVSQRSMHAQRSESQHQMAAGALLATGAIVLANDIYTEWRGSSLRQDLTQRLDRIGTIKQRYENLSPSDRQLFNKYYDNYKGLRADLATAHEDLTYLKSQRTITEDIGAYSGYARADSYLLTRARHVIVDIDGSIKTISQLIMQLENCQELLNIRSLLDSTAPYSRILQEYKNGVLTAATVRSCYPEERHPFRRAYENIAWRVSEYSNRLSRLNPELGAFTRSAKGVTEAHEAQLTRLRDAIAGSAEYHAERATWQGCTGYRA